MQLLLVSATIKEVEPFLIKYPDTEVLITGVGAPVATYQLTRRLHQFDYDLVIQAGIAGASAGISGLTDVFIIGRDTYADLGVFENKRIQNLVDMGFMGANEFPYEDGWLMNPYLPMFETVFPIVPAITVNLVNLPFDFSENYKEINSGYLESMEGAALHYVCLMQQIPFIQMRAVSNYIGERDKLKWKTREAIENLAKGLETFMPQFKHDSIHKFTK